ncbi:MAG: ferrous iron transport protein A [Persephonella sp.]|nr:MAG: ferrous iron transport protein A [Persephonella sp.]RUM60702.1 MAG: ferrous iron transport protein A [Persephonella sp.]
MKKLIDLKEGSKCKIKDLTLNKNIKKKLLELGLFPGQEVVVLQKTPFGGPVRLKVKDYCLALRRKEADNILVDECIN